MANQRITRKAQKERGRLPDAARPPLVALYARVSTGEQATEGMSIDA